MQIAVIGSGETKGKLYKMADAMSRARNLRVKNLYFAETAREVVETAFRNLYISTK